MGKVADFLRANQDRLSRREKKEKLVEEAYTSDAGTYWPPEYQTVAEFDVVDFDQLILEIEDFENSFKGN